MIRFCVLLALYIVKTPMNSPGKTNFAKVQLDATTSNLLCTRGLPTIGKPTNCDIRYGDTRDGEAQTHAARSYHRRSRLMWVVNANLQVLQAFQLHQQYLPI